MKFNDIYLLKDERFSIGIEEESSTYYLSIPVANSYIEYEEYYRIDKSIVDQYPDNFDQVKEIIELCRARKNDQNLIQKPGKNRGGLTQLNSKVA